MKLIVCGGREYADRVAVFAALDRVHAKRPITLLIHGGASGADTLADEWARARGVPCERYPVTRAAWKVQGRRAGPLRNRRMLEAGPDGVVAFPGGRGTADMVGAARAAGVPIWEPMRPKSALSRNRDSGIG